MKLSDYYSELNWSAGFGGSWNLAGAISTASIAGWLQMKFNLNRFKARIIGRILNHWIVNDYVPAKMIR